MAMQARVVSNTPTRKLELRVKSRIAIMQAHPLCDNRYRERFQ